MKRFILTGAFVVFALFPASIAAAGGEQNVRPPEGVLANQATVEPIAGEHNVQPPEGLVPNQLTAVRIAEAILSPIYGQQNIEVQRPFSAELRDDTWHVFGYLPPGSFGGVAEVWISRRDGRIVRVTHGK